MLVAAALVPSTALLVPGAAGRAEVLAPERAAALAAVADVLAAGAARVVLLVGTEPDRAGPAWAGPVPGAPARYSLAAAGVPGRGSTAEPAVAVGHWLLERAGHRGDVDLVLAPQDASDEQARALGERVGGPGPVAVVAVGGLSARRGEDAPLPSDPRAAAVDDAMVAWWTGAGPAVEGGLARELAVSARGPLQVLDATPAAPMVPEIRLLTCPFGATYLVATRLPRATS